MLSVLQFDFSSHLEVPFDFQLVDLRLVETEVAVKEDVLGALFHDTRDHKLVDLHGQAGDQ